MTQLGKQSLGESSYPYLVYASSQVLFPMMTWFIYTDAETYLAYIPLNIAGKCVFLVLSGIWFFHVVPELSEMSFDFFISLGLTLIIFFTDIVSILGMIFVKKGLEKTGKKRNELTSSKIQQNDACQISENQIDDNQHKAEIDSETDTIIGGM